MTKLACSLVFVVLFSGTASLIGIGQESKKEPVQKPDPKKVKELMRRKLENSQMLLEALTVGNLDNAAMHSNALLRISKDVEWRFLNTKEYEKWSDSFRQNAEAVVKAAKEKNLQSARLNYLGMTLDCFNCHSYVREQ